jgi:hypothetical protein
LEKPLLEAKFLPHPYVPHVLHDEEAEITALHIRIFKRTKKPQMK